MSWRTLLVLSWLHLLPSTRGFAAWLQCGRRLDEDEIVMNTKVKKAPADAPLKLVVRNAAGLRVDVPSAEDTGESLVWLDPSDPAPLLSFVVSVDPEGATGLSDLQYVVETAPFEEESPGRAPSPPIPRAPTASSRSTASTAFVGASVGGGVLCGGRRGYARGKTGSVRYELATTRASQEKNAVGASDGGGILVAEIVAGYAEYHGPVTLTPRVLFKLNGTTAEAAYSTAVRGEL